MIVLTLIDNVFYLGFELFSPNALSEKKANKLELLNDIVGAIGLSFLKRNGKNQKDIRNCLLLRCSEDDLPMTLRRSRIVTFFNPHAVIHDNDIRNKLTQCAVI